MYFLISNRPIKTMTKAATPAKIGKLSGSKSNKRSKIGVYIATRRKPIAAIPQILMILLLKKPSDAKVSCLARETKSQDNVADDPGGESHGLRFQNRQAQIKGEEINAAHRGKQEDAFQKKIGQLFAAEHIFFRVARRPGIDILFCGSATKPLDAAKSMNSSKRIIWIGANGSGIPKSAGKRRL